MGEEELVRRAPDELVADLIPGVRLRASAPETGTSQTSPPLEPSSLMIP
jgi:hypothetical protein